MATITFEHVTKRFDETVAVDDLSIDVADGEFLVLVGPSGCGKTTALRMLAGLEDVSSGRILIGDRVVNNVAPGARDIAMVFQSYALYPHMTVFDNLAFGLRNRKAPEERRRAARERSGRDPRARARWSSASRSSSRAGNDSASPSVARSCASRPRSSWTSRSRTSTQRCASRRGRRS